MRSPELVRCVLAWTLSVSTFNAQAFIGPRHPPLPDFDLRQEQAAGAAPPAQAAAASRLREHVRGARVDFAAGGRGKHVGATDGFLTGPDGHGRSVPAAVAARFADEPHRATKAFLQEHRALLGHGPEVLTQARVKRDFITPHNGLRTVVWEQEWEGIAVFEGILVSHTTRRGELVNLSTQFIPDLAQAAQVGLANRPAPHAPPAVSPQQAVARAAQHLGENLTDENVFAGDAAPQGPERRQRWRAAPLQGFATSRLVWLPMNQTHLRLCWDVILTSRTRGERFRVLIDADSGEARLRQCLTVHLSPATYNVFTSDSPSPFSPGWPSPNTNQPPLVSRAPVTLNALNLTASPAGWIEDADNETRGNNTDVFLDQNRDGIPDFPRPSGTPFRVFDFPLDLNQHPTNGSNPQAGAVQAFYWMNWVHDRLYELGFNEAAGNFQSNNFGRGGQGGDPVLVAVQDSYASDNAFYSHSPEGESPVIGMGIWRNPSMPRDSALDAEVLIHEYVHGLSHRLVGGGNGLGGSQAPGMGEGWSDFYGLALLSEPGDDPAGAYATGGYLTHRFYGLTENYYYGIRRYPYSTDLAKNPLTYKDIDPVQASQHTGVPLNPLFQPWTSSDAYEVHSIGEVWCVTLWEVRANLVAKHGHAVGNQLMLQLVTDGMKLSPPNPSFLQARDAILQADWVDTGGANFYELWAGFAKRGLGQSATSPNGNSYSGVREAFDVADLLWVTPLAGVTARGPVGGPFARSTQTLSLTNLSSNAVVWTASGTAPWFDLGNTGGTLPPGANTTVPVSLNSMAALLPTGLYVDNITFSNQTTGHQFTRRMTLAVSQPDNFTEVFDAEDNDLSNQTLTFTPDGSTNFYSVCRSAASSFPTDPTGGTNLSPGVVPSLVTLASNDQVKLYGTATNKFYVGKAGFINVGGSQEYLQNLTVENHFSRLRISPLFQPLAVGTNGVVGTISWKRLADRVAVTWQNLRNIGATNTNSFQVEMFFNGTLRITWLRIDSRGGLAGLSRGTGLPVDFVKSDLSSYDGCGTAITLEVPASVTEGANTQQGRISLAANAPANVTFTLSSSDTSEVTVPATVQLRKNKRTVNFNLTVVNDTVRDGTRTPFITVSAPGYAPRRAYIAVQDNETATLSVNLPGSATEGSAPLAGTVSLSAPAGEPVVVTLASTDTSEVRVPGVLIVSASQTTAAFAATILDDAIVDGSQNATISASVANWTAGSTSVSVLDNDAVTNAWTGPVALTIIRSGSEVLLGWPAAATDFALDAAEALTAPIDWQPVTNTPVLLNDQNLVTEPAANGGRFYRLRKITP